MSRENWKVMLPGACLLLFVQCSPKDETNERDVYNSDLEDVGSDVAVAADAGVDVLAASPVIPIDAGETGDVNSDTGAEFWLPKSTVCGIAPPIIDYPATTWTFAKPARERLGGPYTLADFRADVGTQRATSIGAAADLGNTYSIGGGLWLVEDEDIVLYTALQSNPDDWEGGTISVTVLVDWMPVPDARFEWWDHDREVLKGQFAGSGTRVPMESAAELIDVIIPREVFTERRSYELAVAIRGRNAKRHFIGATFARWAVYAGGAERPSHPCVPSTTNSPWYELLPFELNNYLAGYHFGLLKERELPWEDLPGIHQAPAQARLTFDWYLEAHSPERTVAVVPIGDGKPLGPVVFRQIDKERGFNLAFQGDFEVEMPEEGFRDIYLAEWFDPFYPPQDPDGNWVSFPSNDYHFHGGVRVMSAHISGGSNMARYEVTPPE